ncbi:DUF7692 domain-containing protein [Halovenus salina]|uniref:DUF7692 domain-containing protein n=1 Tax=Halovenus salina TaxID=1510225 RepID=A0ABD5VXE5_9EURY|nr:hypothetical protein [Halovenus salina]
MASFRMRIDGSKEYRAHVLDDAKDLFGESTRTGAVMAAVEHSRQDRKAKAEAMDYLAGELPPEQLAEVADILSTGEIEVAVDVETSIE